MTSFARILFSPLGSHDNPAAVRRIADLAARNDASLTMFGAVSEPSLLQRTFRPADHLEEIREAERRALSTKLARCTPPGDHVKVETTIGSGPRAVAIIRQVLLNGHDLVVVTTDEDDHDQATIRRLLRKCPCPVWVIRRSRARTQRVLAAINPAPEERELNTSILELAAGMIDLYGGEMHVVHAWELYGEDTLRSSAFVQTSATEVDALVSEERARHTEALDALLASTGLDTSSWTVHMVKGEPSETIRSVVSRQRINLLVMGTIARTGLPGLIVGNTAERVLDGIGCSVVALKPPGFVSPITVESW